MSYVDVLVVVVMAIPVAAVVLAVQGLVRWEGKWRVAAGIPVMLLAAWTTCLLLGWPTEHTLWPLELLVYGPLGLVYILVLRAWRNRAKRAAEGRAP